MLRPVASVRSPRVTRQNSLKHANEDVQQKCKPLRRSLCKRTFRKASCSSKARPVCPDDCCFDCALAAHVVAVQSRSAWHNLEHEHSVQASKATMQSGRRTSRLVGSGTSCSSVRNMLHIRHCAENLTCPWNCSHRRGRHLVVRNRPRTL